jgi:HipA-like protein
MMKQGNVFNNNTFAGILAKLNDGTYVFEYDANYIGNVNMPAISLTLPKSQKVFVSNVLFPFFFSLLSEGSNKKLQSKILKIDEDDHFAFLLKTANHETIGAIKIEEV